MLLQKFSGEEQSWQTAWTSRWLLYKESFILLQVPDIKSIQQEWWERLRMLRNRWIFLLGNLTAFDLYDFYFVAYVSAVVWCLTVWGKDRRWGKMKLCGNKIIIQRVHCCIVQNCRGGVLQKSHWVRNFVSPIRGSLCVPAVSSTTFSEKETSIQCSSLSLKHLVKWIPKD